jgi:uncharacterized protein (UPF0264 family)
MTHTHPPRPGLLVSVRSAEEAEAALAGGADVIDVKEPSRGSLGRADDTTIADVVRGVAGRRPVSAALGELRDDPSPCALPGLAYVKWGLAGLAHRQDWTKELDAALAAQRASNSDSRCVMVAYADWSRADAPDPEAVCSLAAGRRAGVLLLDTYHKDGRTLLDWMTVRQVAGLSRRCRDCDVKIALAGSLDRDAIRALRGVNPHWFAVRGAACRRGHRSGTIDERRVQSLKELLAERPILPSNSRRSISVQTSAES